MMFLGGGVSPPPTASFWGILAEEGKISMETEKIEGKKDKIVISRRRTLCEPFHTIIKCMCVACAVYVIYGGLRGTIFPYLHRATYLGFILPIIFFLYPATKKQLALNRPTIIDICLSLLTIFAVILAWVNIDRILWRTPFIAPVYSVDIAMGVIMIGCVFEGCRRVLGWPLVIVGGTFFAYGLWGSNLPGLLSHGGVSKLRLMEFLVLGSDGVFSSITGIGATYLFTFIAFGTFLTLSGVGDMIFNIAKALTKNAVGAPAKIAVISSGFMAMISGSSLANVVTTGSITIPMMKKTGFRNHEAAAFETAASVGGQITPPIMGAGVFIMSEITGVPLITIIKLSILPAILYYLAVYIFINNRIAMRLQSGEIIDNREEKMPLIKEEFKRKGIILLPIILLLTLMLIGFSPYFSSAVAIIFTLVIISLLKSTRMGFKQIINWLYESTITNLTVSAILACAAVVVGVIFQTGFALIASSAIIALSKGILWVTIVLIILMSFVVGMALPITAAYILIAILGVPALMHFGIPLIAAHLAIFWFSQDSTITPPVCMTAFVAADIAGAPRMKTGFTALKFAKGLYIVPFIFLYTKLLTGSLIEQAVVFLITAAGMVLMTIAFDGFWRGHVNIPARIIAGFASLFIFYSAKFNLLQGEGLFMFFVLLIVFSIIIFYDKVQLLRRLFSSTPAAM